METSFMQTNTEARVKGRTEWTQKEKERVNQNIESSEKNKHHKPKKFTFINHSIPAIHPETDAAPLLFAKLNVKFMYSIRTVKSGN